MDIHLFAGSKGGVGKTRCSISLFLYYLRNNLKVSLFDGNVSNIDFFYILTNKKRSELESFEKEEFIRCPVEINLPLQTDPSNRFSYDTFLKKDPFKIYNGIQDFWNTLLKVTQDNPSDALIVDTNFSLMNLISKKANEKNNIKKIIEDLHNLSGVDHVFIWYVWCLNDFLEIKKLDTSDIESYMILLNKVSGGLFSVEKNLIHILNPYLFFDKDQMYELYEFVNRLKSFSEKHQNKINSKEFGGLNYSQATEAIITYLNDIIEKNGTIQFQQPMKDSTDLEQSISELNKSRLNIVVLDNDPHNHSYTKVQLMKASQGAEIDLNRLHVNSFGENTIWKKAEELNEWLKNNNA